MTQGLFIVPNTKSCPAGVELLPCIAHYMVSVIWVIYTLKLVVVDVVALEAG